MNEELINQLSEKISQLKTLELNELNDLSEKIRELIIQVVSRNGGHLSSSLGAVELSVALHSVLNSPLDTLIFDVGHQCYAHKILTGRVKEMYTVRTYQGLSGFPHIDESDHDPFITGHASTAVSMAMGMAEAKKHKQEKSHTVAVIGDGSLTGGMCFEGLNHCGHEETDLLVILNHNEMSISPSVGALSTYLTKIISAPVYNRIRTEFESHLEHFSKILFKRAKKFEESIKGLLVPGVFFEELNFRYYGPIDGHDLELLIPTLKNILEVKGPKLLHVITKKGKGYPHAEDNPEKFHGASSFEIETGKSTKKTGVLSYSEVFGNHLIEMAKKDDRVVALTAAMPKGTGLSKFAETFPDRFYDVGIAEEHLVGFAAGLAKKGMRPYVAIYSTFLQRSIDQVIHDVALQDLPVVFMIDRAGLVGEDGPTHHGVFDVTFMRMIPRMISMACKDPLELKNMMNFTLKLDGPSSIRYPRGSGLEIHDTSPIEMGKFELIEQGENVCLISLGSFYDIVHEVYALLKEKGHHPQFVNARFVKPIDEEFLKSLIGKFSHVFVFEENVGAGGFGSEILEFYEKMDALNKIQIKRIHIPDQFVTWGSRKELFQLCRLDAQTIFQNLLQYMNQLQHVG